MNNFVPEDRISGHLRIDTDDSASDFFIVTIFVICSIEVLLDLVEVVSV